MSDWVYVLLCLVVPAAWSVLVHRAFQVIDRRRRLAVGKERPPVDYSI